MIALATLCAGCAAGAMGIVTSVVPMVASGGAQVINAGVAMHEGNPNEAKEDDVDKCDQLLRVQPGVEEVRKDKDGVIESRQWKIGGGSGAPTWILVHQNHAPEDGWQPKPGVYNLMFNPPLNEMLEPNKPQFLAYAPADVVKPNDSEQFDSMTSAFGSGVGSFKWRERTYSYTMVKQLPCFKSAKLN